MNPQTINLGIGNAGHIFVIISFVASILATFAYGKAALNNETGKDPWVSFGRKVFIAHGIAVIATAVILFLIIYNHNFEYHYAWSHSSVNLAVHYMVACFWEGQEGSFLIWTLWNALLGFVLIGTNKKWEAPVMTVFALVQVFLTSMILGIVIGDFKLGSSSFYPIKGRFERSEVPDQPELCTGRWHRFKPSIAELLDGDSPSNDLLRFLFDISTLLFLYRWTLEKRLYGLD